MTDIPGTWREPIERQLATTMDAEQAFARIDRLLAGEARAGHVVYPSEALRFRALELTPFDQVRVVIVGQDPYHGPGQAHGLAFSVADGEKPPPSLRNILREVRDDIGECHASASLEGWAEQGVLLVNTSLSVRAHEAGSHARQGWEPVTDAIVAAVAAERDDVVFVLWGKHAGAKRPLIEAAAAGTTRHLVLESAHPSPLSASRGFLGCRHFSQTNAWLIKHGHAAIRW